MILDEFGRALVRYERRALGFTDRTLPETDNEPPSGIAVTGSSPEWLRFNDGHGEQPEAR